MISIVDYGMGNLRSVQKAFEEVGYTPRVVDTVEEFTSDELVVLPGVGAFDRAVENLQKDGLWTPVREHIEASGPYLGICLGLQLLFEGSEEGDREGFGYFRGVCRRFRDIKPVPHMGWNETRWIHEGRNLAPGRVEDPCYYFVHSFYPVPERDTIVAGQTDYGGTFVSAVREGSCVGVQFHPEKSQKAGLTLLSTICEQLLNPGVMKEDA